MLIGFHPEHENGLIASCWSTLQHCEMEKSETLKIRSFERIKTGFAHLSAENTRHGFQRNSETLQAMKYIEIQPRDGGHFIIVDGKEVSRHDDVKIAEQVRNQLLAEEIQRASRLSPTMIRVRAIMAEQRGGESFER